MEWTAWGVVGEVGWGLGMGGGHEVGQGGRGWEEGLSWKVRSAGCEALGIHAPATRARLLFEQKRMPFSTTSTANDQGICLCCLCCRPCLCRCPLPFRLPLSTTLTAVKPKYALAACAATRATRAFAVAPCSLSSAASAACWRSTYHCQQHLSMSRIRTNINSTYHYQQNNMPPLLMPLPPAVSAAQPQQPVGVPLIV